MSRKHRHFAADEKAEAVRRYLSDKETVSDIAKHASRPSALAFSKPILRDHSDDIGGGSFVAII